MGVAGGRRWAQAGRAVVTNWPRRGSPSRSAGRRQEGPHGRAEADGVAAVTVVGGHRDRRGVRRHGGPRLGRHERLIAEADHDRVVTPDAGRVHRRLQRGRLALGPPVVVDHADHVVPPVDDRGEVGRAGDDDGLVEAGPDRVPQRPRRERPPAEVAEELVRVAVEAAACWSVARTTAASRHPGRAPDQSTSCTTCGRDRPFSATSRPGLKQNSPELSDELLEQRRHEDLPAASLGRDPCTRGSPCGRRDRRPRRIVSPVCSPMRTRQRHIGARTRPTAERALHVHRAVQRMARAGERDHEAVALRLHFVTRRMRPRQRRTMSLCECSTSWARRSPSRSVMPVKSSMSLNRMVTVPSSADGGFSAPSPG